jgi:hypothetical protein
MSDINASPTENAKKLNTKFILLIIFAVVVVCATVIVVVLLTRPTPVPQTGNATAVPVVDESNLDSLMSELAEKAEKSMFVTYMNMIWHFPDASSASRDAVIGNSESNNYPFYFDVVLRDSGETVYTSSLVPVGMNLKEVYLDKKLPKGEYAAVLTYHLVDDQNEDEVLESNLGFNITLVIES